MKIRFLGQGFEPESKNSVGNYLLNLLLQKDFHTFTGISAFASEAGVLGLSEHIKSAKKNFKRLNLIVGIDEEGTSKEALQEIKNLKINSYFFYQIESPIFHPKIYLFEGDKETKLILGSSNLTARGLFGNVESSLLVEFTNEDKDGKALLTELKEYFIGLFSFNDPNLFEISDSTIQEFIDKGIIPNETVRNKKHGKQPSDGQKTESGIEIPKRPTAKIPSTFRSRPRTDKTVIKIAKELEISESENPLLGEVVWIKKNIPRSIAQQVREGTKIRGVIGLGDAGFKVDGITINRNTYFRHTVFGQLQWTTKKRKSNSPLEEAYCKFNIILLGENLGEHELRISHDPERESNQNNILTDIHWGTTLNAYLKQNSIVGKTLYLHRPIEGSAVFSIVVE